MRDLAEQRKKKMETLQAKGINPFGDKFSVTGAIKEYVDDFQEEKDVAVAGRVMTYREHGKSIFCDLRDFTGKIQLYIRKDKVGDENFDIFKNVDIGDLLGVSGKLFKTRTGEATVYVEKYKYLGKALKPLPEKWHGLKDVELRYRQRYLDLLSNLDVREVFVKRSQIITAIRNSLNEDGFIEVETPMMQSIPGGAVAKPFITHHASLGIDLYLRIAPELYLKRLLVGGFEKVYEINRNFRNEGISRSHNPEFTMLEVYAAYQDCLYMMDLTEDIITNIAKEIIGNLEIKQDSGIVINLTSPWKRISMLDAIKEYTGVDLVKEEKENYSRIAKDLSVEIESGMGPAQIIDEIFKAKVEAKLIQPTFITDYPIELCPLSKPRKDSPAFAERFELYINGTELANAYSELNDPIEQRKRFEEQIANDPTGNRVLDDDFLNALEHGMPAAGGLGIGIDRLVMILTGKESIREVILFPQMRPIAS